MEKGEFNSLLFTLLDDIGLYILVIVAYVIIGFGVVFLFATFEDHNIVEDDPLMMVLLWPVLLVIYIFIVLVREIAKLLHKIGSLIFHKKNKKKGRDLRK